VTLEENELPMLSPSQDLVTFALHADDPGK